MGNSSLASYSCYSPLINMADIGEQIVKGIKRKPIENDSQEQRTSGIPESGITGLDIKARRPSLQIRYSFVGEVSLTNVLAISGRGDDIRMIHSLSANRTGVGDTRASVLEERRLGNTLPATSRDCEDMEISRIVPT